MKRPTTRERLRREGEPTTPRQSASLILVRDAEHGLELLLVKRNPRARFMGGFWVFPGGAVDRGEDHSAAAVRELAEEAGVANVEPESLVAYSRWITPERIEIRFDTRFFVARAPAGARPRVDGEECVGLRWTTPRAALEEHARGELAPVFRPCATSRSSPPSWRGCSIRSISPATSALTAVCCSGIVIHSTRSTLATWPPARPDGGSSRGLYLSNLG